jgi:hypothetical protein
MKEDRKRIDNLVEYVRRLREKADPKELYQEYRSDFTASTSPGLNQKKYLVFLIR